MVAKAKKKDPLILLPMPLDLATQKKQKEVLSETLKQYSLDQIVMQEIYKIYSWGSMKNSAQKRLYRNYSLVYSMDELKNFLLVSYKTILGSD